MYMGETTTNIMGFLLVISIYLNVARGLIETICFTCYSCINTVLVKYEMGTSWDWGDTITCFAIVKLGQHWLAGLS